VFPVIARERVVDRPPFIACFLTTGLGLTEGPGNRWPQTIGTRKICSFSSVPDEQIILGPQLKAPCLLGETCTELVLPTKGRSQSTAHKGPVHTHLADETQIHLKNGKMQGGSPRNPMGPTIFC